MPINFPGSLDTAATLLTAVNNLTTTLNGALAADANGNGGSAVNITVADTTNFPTAGYILIGSEIIAYTGKDATHFTGITRGSDGTVTAIHATGAEITCPTSAAYHNNLKDAAIAIETNILANHDKYGWAVLSASGTRSSATVITVAGDVTSWIQVGDKIKYTDTTTKYGYVASVSYSAPNSTITLFATTDYAFVGNPTAIYYSKLDNPQGFPQWFNVTAPTFNVTEIDNGSGGQPTVTLARYKISGRMCAAHVQGSGVKAGTNGYFSFNQSVFPAHASYVNYECYGPAYAIANGADNWGVAKPNGATALYMSFVTSMTDNWTIQNLSCKLFYEV